MRNWQFFFHQGAAEKHNPVLAMKLTDMLTEQQKDDVHDAHTLEEHARTTPTDTSHTL